MKKVLLLFAMCTSMGAWAQSVIKSVDGTTLTLTCSGNVGEMADVIAPTGKKVFTAAAHDGNQYGYVLTNNSDLYSYATTGSEFNGNGTYYLKVNSYTDPKTPVIDYKYSLQQDVYQFDGTKTYTSKTTGTAVDGSNYYTRISEGTPVSESDMQSFVGDEEFLSSVQGVLQYLPNGMSEQWNSSAVSPGDKYDAEKLYFIGSGDWSSRTYFTVGEKNELSAYLGQSIIDGVTTANLYVLSDGNYTKAAGTVYNASANYVNGVEFSAIEDITISPYTSLAQFVNTTGTTSENAWHKKVLEGAEYVYYIVNNGDPYDSDAVYVQANGATAVSTTTEELETKGFITDQMGSTPYWKALVAEINEWIGAPTTVSSEMATAIGETQVYPDRKVVLTSADPEHIAEIDNDVVQALMSANMRTLDLSGVYLEEIVSPFYRIENGEVKASYNNKGTFCQENQYTQTYNTTIETLYTPIVKEHSVLYNETFDLIKHLHNLFLSEGIEVLEKNSIAKSSSFLSTIIFPESLKIIKARAVADHCVMNRTPFKNLDGKDTGYIETLTFPAGLQEIESEAFAGTRPKDVYFLGVDAPKVGRHAWGDDAYLSNNAFTPKLTIATDGVNADTETGLATRLNYTAQSGWIAMLHYPSTCTKAQAAKYTDVTRDYRRVAYNTYESTDGVDPNDLEMTFSNDYTRYTPGKESTPLKGVGNATENYAVKEFYNMYNPDNENLAQWKEYGGWFGGNYSGGYYDITVGSQIMWPSIGMGYRATVAAQNDVIWNGVTTIGDGIRNAGDTTFEGDGSEYIGLHQFVLAAADANPGKTTEWDMEKYSDGRWHTICLPFNITKAQMKEIFGATGRDAETEELQYHIKLCKFDKVIRTSKNLQLCFNDERFNSANENDIVLQAHVSYMIYAQKGLAVDGATFTGKMKNYVMVEGAPLPTEIKADVPDESAQWYRFIGNYTRYSNDPSGMDVVRVPQYSYFYSNPIEADKAGKFYFQIGTSEGADKTSSNWNPYTSVVYPPYGQGEEDYKSYFTSSPSNSKIRTIILNEEDEEEYVEATEIGTITMESNGELIYTNANIYNLNGQFVGNDIDNLPAGIYVVNGKKYFVK